MNNEHTEFMDIDGPEFIYDVNKEIKNMRERVHDSFHNVDIFNSKETTKQEIELDCYAEIAVLDTNFLISKLGYLDAVLDLANKHPYSLLVILPWIVIKELDGLKNGRKDVALSSRNAMRFIELRLRDKQISLKGQKKNEILDTTLLKNSRAKGDDLILDCCMYFQRLTQDKARMFPGNGSCRITLLSNDRNLCIKAMVHDVNTISADSTLEMEDLLNRIVLKKSLNTTSSNSLQQNEDHGMEIDDVYDEPHLVEDYEMILDNNISPLLHTGDSSYSKWAKMTVTTTPPTLPTRQQSRPYLDHDPTLTAPKRPYRPQHTSIFK